MINPPHTAGAALEWATYSDARSGLTLEHPRHWSPQRGVAGLLLAVAGPNGGDGFAPNVNVVRRVNDVRLSLDDLARAAVREVRRVLTDVALLDLEACVVSETPARRLLFTYRQGIYGLTGEQWVWLTRDHIWTLTAGAATEDYAQVAEVFSRVARSLRVGDV